jgi:hypothetical protein
LQIELNFFVEYFLSVLGLSIDYIVPNWM